MSQFALPTGSRLLIEATLAPLQGGRFQPTGFPDVGAATYTLPDGTEQLLVESAQSVANRLEAVCWDDETQQLVSSLTGLSYVRVTGVNDELLTTSVQEAHRLNSVYIENTPWFAQLKEAIAFDEKKPFSRDKLVAALARFDIGCLLHGVFLESIAGVLRIPRALSGFIEASQVGVVQSGGVKNDRVAASTDKDSTQTAKEGFGNVPFHRSEFVADKICAFFNIDLNQIRSYRLGNEVNELLYALSIFKIHKFLESGLRLRTACDLGVVSIAIKSQNLAALPSLASLEEALPRLIQAAAAKAKFETTTTAFVIAEKAPKLEKTKGGKPKAGSPA